MKNYTTLESGRHTHVLCDNQERQNYPLANYRGTDKALCGILRKGQTLEQWVKKFGKTIKEQ